MYPAFSVIFFTVVSGCGYGILGLLGITLAFDAGSVSRNQALTALVAGALMAAAGLTSSTLHLGQPQRAWRAFSQWRSSWLSREGVAAMATFVPLIGVGACIWFDKPGPALQVGAAALATLAAITVGCTAQIYTSLKPIPAWRDARVLPGYLSFAVLGGSAWWLLLCRVADPGSQVSRWSLALLPLAALGTAALKRSYWHAIDTTPGPASIESATGLGRFGTVHSSERPHTEANYLTNEMGYVLARKHSSRLRSISLVMFGIAPFLLGTLALLLDRLHPHLATLSIATATVAVTAGAFIERWLFFAEAKHLVMLFYGSRRE